MRVCCCCCDRCWRRGFLTYRYLGRVAAERYTVESNGEHHTPTHPPHTYPRVQQSIRLPTRYLGYLPRSISYPATSLRSNHLKPSCLLICLPTVVAACQRISSSSNGSSHSAQCPRRGAVHWRGWNPEALCHDLPRVGLSIYLSILLLWPKRLTNHHLPVKTVTPVPYDLDEQPSRREPLANRRDAHAQKRRHPLSAKTQRYNRHTRSLPPSSSSSNSHRPRIRRRSHQQQHHGSESHP